jgi:hypothetical protein
MKIRLLIAIVGLALSFALPTFAQQQKDTTDPQIAQQDDALAKKFDEARNNNHAAALFTKDAVLSTTTAPIYPRWTKVKDITASIQSVLSSIALLVGAIWVYYRFVIFRTLKPRLEFSINIDKFMTGPYQATMIIKSRVCNKGNTKVDLTKARHRCYLRYGLLETTCSTNITSVVSRSSKELSPIDNIFAEHTAIEPSEAIDDVKVITMPVRNWGVVQLEVAIWGYYTSFFRQHLRRYSAATAFQITGNAVNSSFTSEDEQAEYKEWEETLEALEMRRNKLKEKLESSKTTENQKKEWDELIERATALMTDLSREKPERGVLLKKSDELIKILDERLGLRK